MHILCLFIAGSCSVHYYSKTVDSKVNVFLKNYILCLLRISTGRGHVMLPVHPLQMDSVNQYRLPVRI